MEIGPQLGRQKNVRVRQKGPYSKQRCNHQLNELMSEPDIPYTVRPSEETGLNSKFRDRRNDNGPRCPNASV